MLFVGPLTDYFSEVGYAVYLVITITRAHSLMDASHYKWMYMLYYI